MHEAIALTYLVAARIEPGPAATCRRHAAAGARARLGALLVAIRRAPQPEPELRWRDLGERPNRQRRRPPADPGGAARVLARGPAGPLLSFFGRAPARPLPVAPRAPPARPLPRRRPPPAPRPGRPSPRPPPPLPCSSRSAGRARPPLTWPLPGAD